MSEVVWEIDSCGMLAPSEVVQEGEATLDCVAPLEVVWKGKEQSERLASAES